MNTLTIAGIGELLWDVLPDAENLGGAPVNFAYHVTALGAEGIAISTVGDDERGRRALEELRRKGMRTACISTIGRYPTGSVTARLDEHGVATYVFPDDVAWDHLSLNAAAEQYRPRLSAICFGTLAQRSAAARHTLHGYLDTAPTGIPRVYDLNLRQHFYTPATIEASLALSSVLKLNDEELSVLSDLFKLSGGEDERLAALQARYDLDLVILTKGGRGSTLLSATQISKHPGIATEVVDTIGAGDSFTAATVLGLLLGRNLDDINEKANRLAAYVCTRSGAMPPVPDRFRYDR